MGRSKKIAIADGSSGSGDGADTTEVAAAIVEDDEEFAALLDAAEARQEPNRERLKLSLKSDGQCCHVCGKKGHRAGFVGSRYVDCINRPCYLCKQEGHTTATCPFRVAPELGCRPAASVHSGHVTRALLEREADGKHRELRLRSKDWQVDAAIVKLHSRRCTTLEFHPYRDNLVLSGDKKGQVAVWDFEAVHQRRLFPHINTCLTNNIRFMPESGEECCSAASDGTVKAFDIECGVATTLLDLNPHGYDGVPSHWGMFYGLSVEASTHAVLAGDSHGRVTVMDARQPPGSGAAGACGALQLHRPGTKVVSIDCHPLSSFLVMSAGNDHTARLFDLRKMAGGGAVGDRPASGSKAATQFSPHPAQLAVLQHGRVVNSAVFSPRSGRRILTTCQDNRLRVWDNVGSCWHGPDREIVHSHDFNRYLTPFKAEFDPKDLREATVVIGRYISEDFGGLALHPVDIFDVATGKLTQELVDRNLITICPVNKFHPRRDVIVTGSSRSLFLWRPVSDANEADADADSENTSAGNGSAEAPGMPRSSASFMLFDADHDDDAKKKKRSKAQTATQAQAAAADDDVKKKKRGKAQTATLEQAAAAEDDAKKKKRGKAQTATQAQAAAADDNAKKKKRGKAQTASEQQPVGGDDDAKKARKRCTAQTASKQEPVGCDVDNDAKRTKRDSKTPAASTQQAVGGDDSAKKMKNKRGKAHSAMEQQAARPARDERAQTSGSERNSRNPAGADDRKDGGSHRRRKE